MNLDAAFELVRQNRWGLEVVCDQTDTPMWRLVEGHKDKPGDARLPLLFPLACSPAQAIVAGADWFNRGGNV